jgi:hypothetical protein
LSPRTFGLSAGAKRDEGTNLLEQRGGQNIFLEMWGRLDPNQFFSLFNEWINMFKYVIKSEGEYNAKETYFASIAYIWTKIEISTGPSPSYASRAWRRIKQPHIACRI